MANNILTPSMITRYSIRMFLNTNYFIQNVSRQFESQFGIEGARIGAQLRIRYANQYTVTDGPGISIQDTTEQQFLLAVATQRHVDVAFTSAETTLDVDDYMERIVLPRVNALAANVALQVMVNTATACRNAVANVDANNNILPITDGPIALARAILEENSAPNFGEMGMRKVVLAPRSDTRIQQALRGLFNPVESISRQYNTGMMYEALQFRLFEDQSVVSHTTGTLVTATVNGANQTGQTLTVNRARRYYRCRRRVHDCRCQCRQSRELLEPRHAGSVRSDRQCGGQCDTDPVLSADHSAGLCCALCGSALYPATVPDRYCVAGRERHHHAVRERQHDLS